MVDVGQATEGSRSQVVGVDGGPGPASGPGVAAGAGAPAPARAPAAATAGGANPSEPVVALAAGGVTAGTTAGSEGAPPQPARVTGDPLLDLVNEVDK